MLFDSKFDIVGEPFSIFTRDDILKEPILWDADYEFAMTNGGIIVADFIKSLPDNIPSNNMRFFIRVHDHEEIGSCLTMRGWHNDVLLRNVHGQGKDAQTTDHYAAWCGDDIATTEVCDGVLAIPDELFSVQGDSFWNAISDLVDEHIQSGTMVAHKMKPSTIYHWDGKYNFHRGPDVYALGCRIFIKVIISPHPPSNIIK